MHVRHVALRIKPDRIDDAVAIFEGSALPLLREQDGFRGACMLADPASGEGVIMVFWAHRDDSVRLEAAGFYRQQIAKFADVFAAPPRASLLELRVGTPEAPSA